MESRYVDKCWQLFASEIPHALLQVAVFIEVTICSSDFKAEASHGCELQFSG
jgi:hypothetical protein